MNEKKIDNTFHAAYDQIERLGKVFRKGGLLEQAIMEVGGDPAYLEDVRKAFDDAHDALQEAHYGALVHLEMEESVTESKKLTEGVLDGDDEDGFMARSQLYFLAKDAISLHGMIDDRDNLEPWVQAKITAAAKDMEAVRRYTEYQAMKADMQLPVVADPEADRPVSIEMDDMEEAADNPYAVGMSQAMKSTGDRPPLKKATIRKAHDIAKAIEKSDESVMEAKFSPEQQDRLDDLIQYLRLVTDPEYWPDNDSDDLGPAEILDTIRSEFGDKVADQVKSGLDNVWHWGRSNRDNSNDYLSWRKNTRVNKSGNANKTDINALKNTIKRDKGSFAKDPSRLPESEGERPYVCVHAKKGTHKCTAGSSYEAAKKAAQAWGLKSTAGIDAHLADVEKVAEEAKFDDKRDGELKTVAQNMFKNALAAAKKKATK